MRWSISGFRWLTIHTANIVGENIWNNAKKNIKSQVAADIWNESTDLACQLTWPDSTSRLWTIGICYYYLFWKLNCPTEDRRLSWSGWLDGLLVTHPNINVQHLCKATLLYKKNALPVSQTELLQNISIGEGFYSFTVRTKIFRRNKYKYKCTNRLETAARCSQLWTWYCALAVDCWFTSVIEYRLTGWGEGGARSLVSGGR